MISRSFHPEVDSELEEASVFYESRMVGLGKRNGRKMCTNVEVTHEIYD